MSTVLADSSASGMQRPSYGFYGDDFTGATDTLAHLASAGWRALLFLRAPSEAQLRLAGPLDAVGVAGTARAMAPAEMRTELNGIGQCFARLGVRVMHYKVCSTFDSSPAIGNIGTAIATLREHFVNPLVAVIGGQPNLRRYCVFGNLFASAGSAAQVYRIDRHPVMSRHPVTPSQESDLRRVLESQGLAAVELVDYRWYQRAPGELADEVERCVRTRAGAVLFDVAQPDDLRRIGGILRARAQQEPLLVVGASSVALAITSEACGPRAAAASAARLEPASGPVFVLAGSLSPITARQIAGARSYQTLELDPAALCGAQSASYLSRMVHDIAAGLRGGRSVLAFTRRVDGDGAKPKAEAEKNQARLTDGAALARACAELLRQVLDAVPLKRAGVAGGDTSSFGVQALDAWGLSHAMTLAPGVAVCRLHSRRPHLDGMELMLKGGQMGDDDLFERLLAGTA